MKKTKVITEEKTEPINLALVKETIEKLLKLLSVEGEFSAEVVDGGIEVVLDTQDTGVVIGYHGEVLESLQLIMALCVSKKLGYFVRVSLEVGDYKKNRTGFLENLAQGAKEQALLDGKEVPLPSLKSWERRIVHMFFQDDKEVVSESVGEGKDRTLIVKPR